MTRQEQWTLLDNFRRKTYIKYEIKTILLRSIIKNRYIPSVYRYHAAFQKASLPRNASSIKHNNRCVVTGRNLNVIQKVRLSRFEVRKNAYQGNLPGMRRSSW